MFNKVFEKSNPSTSCVTTSNLQLSHFTLDCIVRKQLALLALLDNLVFSRLLFDAQRTQRVADTFRRVLGLDAGPTAAMATEPLNRVSQDQVTEAAAILGVDLARAEYLQRIADNCCGLLCDHRVRRISFGCCRRELAINDTVDRHPCTVS
jgi:hypothetical protein